jgi:hypothetical protein
LFSGSAAESPLKRRADTQISPRLPIVVIRGAGKIARTSPHSPPPCKPNLPIFRLSATPANLSRALATFILNFCSFLLLFHPMVILFGVQRETAMTTPRKTKTSPSVSNNENAPLVPYADVQKRIIVVRGLSVILDADVAALYGVETKRVNEAVRNNPDKFPSDYMFALDPQELEDLRSKISSAKPSPKSRALPKAFTEKGLYMLATVLKSRRAVDATFAIIKTFAKVRGLRRDLLDLHAEKDRRRQSEKMRRFGETLADVIIPDLDAVETESTLELNFLIGKLKHTVRRVRKPPP